MLLAAEEFLRRFLLHTLPPGFQRIRYFGWLANCQRKRRIEQLRTILAEPVPELLPASAWNSPARLLDLLRRCPICRVGVLIRTRLLERGAVAVPAYLDSS
jgi:hypothetical protein